MASTETNCGRLEDGDVYCWGANKGFLLGLPGTVSASATPVLIQADVKFAALSAGRAHLCGLTAAGEAYCWGENLTRQLGNALQDNASPTPLAVQGNLTFKSISAGGHHTCAIATDDTGWCWGANGSGELGIGTATTYEANPQTIPGLKFRVLEAGKTAGFTCGTTLDGASMCWGNNITAKLGIGRYSDVGWPPILWPSPTPIAPPL